MKNSNCLFNSAVALRRVFLSGVLASDAIAIQQQAPSRLLRQQQQALCASRPFSTQPALYKIARNSAYKNAEAQPQKKNFLPRDNDIRAPFVHIIGPNGISAAVRTRDVLRDLKRGDESLVMVSQGSRGGMDRETEQDSNGRFQPQWPVCKIVDVKAERQEEYRKKKEERKKTVNSKELEINWGIAMHDLEMTKLRQLKKFLAKGLKVQITLVAKGKSRKSGKKNVANDDEAEEVYNAIRAAVAEIPGCTEGKVEGVVGRQMTLVYQGPANGYTPPPTSDEVDASSPVAAVAAAAAS